MTTTINSMQTAISIQLGDNLLFDLVKQIDDITQWVNYLNCRDAKHVLMDLKNFLQRLWATKQKL